MAALSLKAISYRQPFERIYYIKDSRKVQKVSSCLEAMLAWLRRRLELDAADNEVPPAPAHLP